MKMRLHTRCLLASCAIMVSGMAFGQFWDQGAVDGAARSDFNSSQKGTMADPLWNSDHGGYLTWPNSNWVQYGNTSNGYWVFHANDEPILGPPDYPASAAPDGPPGQVHDIAVPGTTGHGFFYTHIDEGNQNDGLHFLINTDLLGSAQARRDWSDIPFLSVGAERDRGNNGVPIGILNGLEHWYYGDYYKLRFDARLWESHDGAHGDSYRHAGFYIIAEWCGSTPQGTDCTPRGIFIDLHEAASDTVNTIYPADGLTRYDDWPWPYPASFFDPGAEWLFARMDAFPDLATQYTECQGVMAGTGAGMMLTPSSGMKSYQVHLRKLYECLDHAFTVRDGYSWSVPFPSSEVEVRGIHWYVEASRNGNEGDQTSAVMWFQVGNPRMTKI